MGLGLIPRLNYRINFRDLSLLLHSGHHSPVTEEKLKDYFGNSPVYFTDSARSALMILLKSSGIPAGSKVGVTSYNCLSVFNSVRLAGYSPVFIDINRDFTISMPDLERKVQDIHILIVSHLFGRVTDIGFIKNLYPDLPVIEDCAHSFLSKDQNDRFSGTNGDYAVFSLNSAKFLAIGGGGFLIINNRIRIENIEKEIKLLKQIPWHKEIVGILRKITLSVLHNPIIYRVLTAPVKSRRKNRWSEFSDKHITTKISRFDLMLYEKQLNRISEIYRRQRNNGEMICRQLNISDHIQSQSNYFMIPFLFKGDRELAISSFRKNGIELGQHFSSSLNSAKEFGYVPGSCPIAEEVSAEIITIPCYYSLTGKEVKKILNQVKKLQNEHSD